MQRACLADQITSFFGMVCSVCNVECNRGWCGCRGDVGSWVREAAVTVLPHCLVLLCCLDPEGARVPRTEQAALTHLVIKALLKQSVERIARLREVCHFSHCAKH